MQRTGVLVLCGKTSLAILGPVLFVLVALFLTFTYIVAVLLTLLYWPRAVLISKLNW